MSTYEPYKVVLRPIVKALYDKVVQLKKQGKTDDEIIDYLLELIRHQVYIWITSASAEVT